jgi:replication initiation and membrane attachment protein DnaB
LTDVYIREGTTRSGFTMVYHELFDLYHPYIGDKATLYYLYLLRYRNGDKEKAEFGRSWRGRNGVVEKFQLSYSTLPLLDRILEASGLIEIERKPCGRGRDKIYYIVNDPLEYSEFKRKEREIAFKLAALVESESRVRTLLGKGKGTKLTLQEIDSTLV